MQPYVFNSLSLRGLKLQPGTYSGRIMTNKLGSLLPVSGFITATEGSRQGEAEKGDGERQDYFRSVFAIME